MCDVGNAVVCAYVRVRELVVSRNECSRFCACLSLGMCAFTSLVLRVLFFVRLTRCLSVDSMRRVTILGNGTRHSCLSLHAAQTGVDQHGSC